MTLVARTRSRVWGSRDAWSFAPHREWEGDGHDCAVELEIQGDDARGYHLVISPAGFFTADSWYETLTDAYEAAVELFDIAPKAWTAKQEGEKA